MKLAVALFLLAIGVAVLWLYPQRCTVHSQPGPTIGGVFKIGGC